MTQLEETPEISTRPQLEAEDFEAPFLHESTPLKHVLIVLLTLLIVFVAIGVLMAIA